MASATRRPDIVVKLSSSAARSPRDQREQVGGLRERVVPARRSGGRRAGRRRSTGLPLDSSTGQRARSASIRHRVDGEHVRAVGKVGDAAEALRLALRAEHAGRQRTGPRARRWRPGRCASGSSAGPIGGGACSVSAVGVRVHASGGSAAPSSATVTSCCCSPSRTSGGGGAPGRPRRPPDCGGTTSTAVTTVAAGSSSKGEIDGVDEVRRRPVVEPAHGARRHVAGQHRRRQPLTSSSSTSNTSVALGGITPPAPRSP